MYAKKSYQRSWLELIELNRKSSNETAYTIRDPKVVLM